MSAGPPAILPHGKAKGIDICRGDGGLGLFIVRSDLHCYMKRSYDQKSKSNKYEVFPLHPAYQNFDHYIYNSTAKAGGISPNFILIKDSKFLTVGPDLSNANYGGSNAVDGEPLSAAMSNGENYCYDGSNYYKFYNGGKDCMAAPSLTSENPTHHSVPSSYQNGLYYYGTSYPPHGNTVVVLTTNSFGVVSRLLSTKTMQPAVVFFVSPDVLAFLPGGLAFSYGRPIHGWQLLKSYENSSKVKLSWSASITKTVGFSESAFHSLEKRWNVTKSASIGTSFEKSFLIKANIQAQFSLSTEYGGASIQSNQADWNEQQSTTESLTVDVGPGETAYIWQYRLGFAGMPNSFLWCRDLAITNSNKPPTTGRLPDALKTSEEAAQKKTFSSEATHEIPQGAPGSPDTPPSSDPMS